MDAPATAVANFIVKEQTLIGFTRVRSGFGAAGIRLTATKERSMGRS
jgi:hypothetical protein